MQERVSSGLGRVIPSRKVSLLAAMVAAGALFYSALAPALGLGSIELHSSLNQPLNADIELVDAEGLDRSDLAVGLATADEYARAGIDRAFFLNDLRFTPVFQGNRKFIHVSSVRPVTEPYLSFLVQVSRPGGQLLRDYTLLLDPAGSVRLSPASIPTGSTALADQGTDFTRAAAMSSAPPPAPPKPAAKPAAAPPAASENKRYTVAAGDTLWTVGKKLTAAGTPTPPNQLVRELRELNPERGPLQVGQSLRVPDSAVLPSAAGQAAPATDSDAQPPRGTPGAGNAQTPEQLTAIALQNQQLQQSLDEANARLQVLEQEQALKDQQLADLQARAAGVAAPALGQGAPANPPATPTGAPANAAAPPASGAVTPSVSAPQTPSATPAAAPPGGAAVAPGTAPGNTLTPPAAPAPVAPVAQSASDDNTWLLIAGALAAVLLLLAALLLARRRRRQPPPAHFEPVLAITPVNDDVVVRPARTPVVAVTEAQLNDTARYSDERGANTQPPPAAAAPASPRRESGPATDALDGASIYIAYGRFNEALGILREGLSNEPSRTDLRLRMLEVLGQQGDAHGYAEQEALLLAGGYSATTLEQNRTRYPKLAAAPAPAPDSVAPARSGDAVATAAEAGVIAAGVAAAQALEREPTAPIEAQEQLGAAFAATPPADAEESPASPDLAGESLDLQADDFPDLGDFDDTPAPPPEPLPEHLPESFDEFQLNLDDLSLDADWGMVSPFDTPGRPKVSAPPIATAPPEVDHEFASNLKELPEVFEMPDEQFLSDFADPQLHVDLEPGIELDEQPDTHPLDQDALDNAFLDSFIADADLPELDALTVDFDDLERQQASAQSLEQAQSLIEQGDFAQASDLLLELLREGDDSSKHAARLLLSSIS